MKEKKWITRARETHNFHAEKRKANKKWRLSNTAKVLGRSIGSVSEDLLVARWLRSHLGILEEFEYLNEALEWIRDNQDELHEMKID